MRSCLPRCLDLPCTQRHLTTRLSKGAWVGLKPGISLYVYMHLTICHPRIPPPHSPHPANRPPSWIHMLPCTYLHGASFLPFFLQCLLAALQAKNLPSLLCEPRRDHKGLLGVSGSGLLQGYSIVIPGWLSMEPLLLVVAGLEEPLVGLSLTLLLLMNSRSRDHIAPSRGGFEV